MDVASSFVNGMASVSNKSIAQSSASLVWPLRALMAMGLNDLKKVGIDVDLIHSLMHVEFNFFAFVKF